MTTAHRAFLGAILGAIIALFAHPLSRPWLQYGLWRFTPSEAVSESPHLALTLKSLPEANSDENISLFVQIAAEKLSAGENLKPEDALLLAELCRNAAEKDSQNAFWRQNEAVFQYALGNEEAAKTAWKRASERQTWTDYQTKLIEKYLNDLVKESGASMAWHSASAIQNRSTATPRVIHSLGTTLLLNDLSLENRADTFANAILMRDNARSRIGSWYGYQLAETSATGPIPISGPKRFKSFIRAEFPTELFKAGLDRDGNDVAEGLRENDAYLALVFSTTTQKKLRQLTGESILLGSLPGSFLLASVVSFFLLLLTFSVPIHRLGNAVSPKIPTLIALTVSLITYVVTQQLLVSLWLLLVISLFAIHPPLTLTSPTLKIPRSCLWAGSAFSILLASFFVAAAVVYATPFQSLKASLPSGWWSQPEQFFLGGILLVVGGFVLTMQVVAYRLKRPAGRFFILLARHGFTQASIACLFASIVFTPACIYLDDHVNREMKKIALNETAYYLNK